MKRRHLLRSAGITLALPAFESLGFRAFAAENANEAPRRLAFLYVPNGVNVANWDVTSEGKDYRLSPTLAPLAELRDEFTVISGLDHQEAHHQISHHRDDETKLTKIAKIDRFYTGELARFLGRLREVDDENGANLLDQSMIVYGSGIKEGNKHTHEDLPVILAGKGGGSPEPGRHLRAPKGTPMTNLYLGLIERMGAKVDRVGDSTGELGGV